MSRLSSATLLAALAAAGCTEIDPYARPGAWQPTGANARNIAAMAANKQDLIRGRTMVGSDPVESTAAVLRLWEGAPHVIAPVSSRGGG